MSGMENRPSVYSSVRFTQLHILTSNLLTSNLLTSNLLHSNLLNSKKKFIPHGMSVIPLRLAFYRCFVPNGTGENVVHIVEINVRQALNL